MIPFIALMTIVSLSLPHNTNCYWTNLDITSVESMNGTTGHPIVYNIRMKRIKRGVYGFAGTALITEPFDDYMSEVLFYHSALRNNVYQLFPISMPEGPLCPKVEKSYRKYLMKDAHKISDLPYSEDASANLCAMFEKNNNYTIRNFQFDKSLIPSFLPTGMYKMHYMLKKDGMITCGVELFADLS